MCKGQEEITFVFFVARYLIKFIGFYLVFHKHVNRHD